MSESRSFEQASRHIRENLSRHISKYDSMLGEDDSGDSEGDEELNDKVVDELLSHYRNADTKFIVSARQLLKTALQSASCLICIETIKKTDGIWTCETCYASLHLNCILKWSKDSIFMLKQQQEEDPGKTIELCWSCPNCRTTYTPKEVPSKYLCYCGKQVDPKFDPWLNPHSCGEKCGKGLKPECKHKCVLLCHPGPCPPCPQMVTVTCYCAKSTPSVKRCSASNWSCNTTCGTLLACGTHTCPEMCHPGPCPPCSKSSTQSCACGKMAEPRACSAPVWKCGTKCGKKLACGHHVCDYICHEKGDCPPCPLSLIRHCPCGKSDYKLPCVQATPTCGDTCGKLMSCGNHYCAERCHRGNCPSCLQMVKKTCKCGSKSKDVQCSKQFSCDIKCKKIRDCRKHPCNKKCCSGDCAPCENMCGKSLNCKNHKCTSRCHQGACYPCNKQTEVSCACGSTKIKVPCGKEKNTKPPKCRQLCNAKSNCHHKEQIKHMCHYGKCPVCKQICNKERSCGHTCPEPCHDNVSVKIERKERPVGPWEVSDEQIIKKLPCPPCPIPVPVPCLGQHEIADFPCHNSKPTSCGRLCGRKLACTNHSCERPCHRVRQAVDEVSAGINCKKCSKDCEIVRPEGCDHACQLGCHPGPCQTCEVNVKLNCHCGLMTMHIKCGILTAVMTDQEKEELTCCKDQCPKLMTCGHRCLLTCHSGICSPAEDCKKKIKLACPCKRIKQDDRCNNISLKNPDRKLYCDEECHKLKEEERKTKISEKSNVDEDIRNKEETERFVRLMEGRGKKKKKNKKVEEIEEESFYDKNRIYVMSFTVLLIILVLGYFFSQ